MHSVPLLLPSSAPQTPFADEDEARFRAFNLSPDPFAGHEAPPDLHGPLPRFTDRTLRWTPLHGQSGWVPFTHKTGLRAKTAEYHGVRIDQILRGTHSRIYARQVTSFNIRYTIAYPAALEGKPRELDLLPLIGDMHGVPGNRYFKIEKVKELAKFAVVVMIDMLGMGESDQVLDMHFPGEETSLRAWDWEYDVDYVHQLMTEEIANVLGLTRGKRWIFSSDDWGAGIGLRYLARYGNAYLLHSFFISPIWLDGYPVIEIATIGQLAAVRKANLQQFHEEAAGMPQKLVGIEKYMVEKRWKMNRYTESSYLATYQDVDYQSGRSAAEMPANFWNLAVLADRASRLSPRQLQPWAPVTNPRGVRLRHVTAPVTMIWGLKDQMMPPSQVFRSAYLFPKAEYNYYELPDANHFSEIDDPHAVVRAMLNELLRKPALRKTIPIFLGNGPYVMKGDEKQLRALLQDIAALQMT